MPLKLRPYTGTGPVLHTHTHTQPFNGPLSGTTRVSRYQKGKTNLDSTEASDSEWQWRELGHMQVCTSLHASAPPLSTVQICYCYYYYEFLNWVEAYVCCVCVWLGVGLCAHWSTDVLAALHCVGPAVVSTPRTPTRLTLLTGLIYVLSLLPLLRHPFNGLFSRTTWVSQYQKGQFNHTHTPVQRPFFQDYLGKPVPERLNKSGFYWSERQWVAVASAGPYANLHLAPDR